MRKRVLAVVMAAYLAAGALSGCGGKKTDHYMVGYDAVKEKRYEDALESFRLAAAEGDEQSRRAADIVAGYLNAKEAFRLGDIESAKAFLEEIPENYKYYAIGEDIDALRRSVYGYQPTEPEPSETPAEDEEASEIRERNDRNLQQAGNLIAEGRLDAASAYLEDLETDALTEAQREKLDRYRREIAKKQEMTKEEPDHSLSPEKAAEYLRAAYPEVQGDVGDALMAQYDEEGNLFYVISIQIGQGEDAQICTLHILRDGTVERVS